MGNIGTSKILLTCEDPISNENPCLDFNALDKVAFFRHWNIPTIEVLLANFKEHAEKRKENGYKEEEYYEENSIISSNSSRKNQKLGLSTLLEITLKDVEKDNQVVLDEMDAKERKELNKEELRKRKATAAWKQEFFNMTVTWPEYYDVMYSIINNYVDIQKEQEMKTWHPSCQGYAMVASMEAIEDYQTYLLQSVERVYMDDYQKDNHTDDEQSIDSQDEEEEMDKKVKALEQLAEQERLENEIIELEEVEYERDEETGEVIMDEETGQEMIKLDEDGEPVMKKISMKRKEMTEEQKQKYDLQLQQLSNPNEGDGEIEGEGENAGNDDDNNDNNKKKKKKKKNNDSDDDDDDDSDEDLDNVDDVVLSDDEEAKQYDSDGNEIFPEIDADADDTDNTNTYNSEEQEIVSEVDTLEEEMKNTKIRFVEIKPELPDLYNPQITNPIFFGYYSYSIEDVKEQKEQQKFADTKHEEGVVKREKVKRRERFELATRIIETKRQKRNEKLQLLKSVHSEKKRQRVMEKNDAKAVLPPEEYRDYCTNYDLDNAAVEMANAIELQHLMDINNAEDAKEDKELYVAAQQLQGYEEDDDNVRPSGKNLVQLATEEMESRLEAMEEQTARLEAAQRSLVIAREELEECEDELEQEELRLMLMAAQGDVNEKKQEVEVLIKDVEDGEIMLKRSLLRKQKEDKILPIWRPLAHDDYSKEMRVSVLELIISMITISHDVLFEKLRLVQDLFDLNANLFMDTFEIELLLNTVFSCLKKIGFFTITISKDETQNLIFRAVNDIAKGHNHKGLSFFEFRQWMIMTIGRSKHLSNMFKIDWVNAEVSTFMRQKMNPITLYEKGMITSTDLKYHYSFNLVTFRERLHIDGKTDIHDLALAMGADDPLKPDYSRFIPKRSSKNLSNVVPLEHGHLMNYKTWLTNLQNRSATKIQSICRGILGRLLAENVSRGYAFLEAREVALDRMKETVRAEILENNLLTGVAKIKWDAKVKLKQAKLRAEGRLLDIDGTIEAMISEAIDEGTEQVCLRFAEIGDTKGITPYLPTKDQEWAEKYRNQKDNPPDLEDNALQKEVARKKQEDIDAKNRNKAVADLEEGRIETPRADGENQDLMESQQMVANLEKHSRFSTLQDLSKRRLDAVIKGSTPPELYIIGELFEDLKARHTYLMPDCTSEKLFDRFQYLSKVFSILKTRELMMELPSKRLVLQLIRHINFRDLPEELDEHFRIERDSAIVAKMLLDIADSDLESGTFLSFTNTYHKEEHEVLQKFCNKIVNDGILEAKSHSDKMARSAVMRGLDEEQRILAIVEKESEAISKKREQILQNSINMEKAKKKLENAFVSMKELVRRTNNYKQLLKKVRKDPVDRQIPVDMRIDWIGRLTKALNEPEDDDAQMVMKYSEIANVSNEFFRTAQDIAMIIIKELYYPVHEKTIKPILEREVDGRAVEGGRSVDNSGKRYKYEASNIRFKIYLDDDGVFNGSDEFAAKAGGAEIRSALEFFKVHQEGLIIPMMCSIDYQGYRVLCVSKMSIEQIIFNNTGDIRRRKEEFVLGTTERGAYAISTSNKLDKILEKTGKHINLKKHSIKGSLDMNPKIIYTAADVKGFQGANGDFYLMNFWRCMPPEDPDHTPHLVKPPRGQSIFWRFMRPELVRRNKYPLNPDALSMIINGIDIDKVENDVKEIEDTSKRLVSKVCPDFCEWLANRKIDKPAWQGYGIDITRDMHRHGINVRHMGYLRTFFWRPLGSLVNVAYNADHIVTHGDLRDEVLRGQRLKIFDDFFNISTNPKRPFTARECPVEPKIRILSQNYCTIECGVVKNVHNSPAIRNLFLAEMTVRSVKNILRFMMRNMGKITKRPPEYMYRYLICEWLNFLTSAHKDTQDKWNTQIYHAIRDRFGTQAISTVELPNILLTLEPVIIYMVSRFQAMLGFTLKKETIAYFHDQPRAFRFTEEDFITSGVRIKHNISILAFAEASLLARKAETISALSYTMAVLQDRPLLFWKFSERRGARVALNIGTLGAEASGYYSSGAKFEQEGPIVHEAINRAVRLSRDSKSKVDTKFFPELCQVDPNTHFTAELWVKIIGSKDINRTIINGGRFSISASRENTFWLSIYAGIAEVVIKGPKFEENRWYHIVGNYDGVIMKFFIDAKQVGQKEVDIEVHKKTNQVLMERKEKLEELNNAEELARNKSKEETEGEAKEYFRTREGQRLIKKAAMKLVEQSEFKIKMDKNAEEKGLKKLTKQDAIRQAKLNFKTELYLKNSATVTEDFIRQRQEMIDLTKMEDDEAAERATQAIRVGAMAASKTSKSGRLFLDADICYVCVYDKCLQPDRITAHYLVGAQDRSGETDRLFSLSAAKYRESLLFAPDDPLVLRKYAQSLVASLQADAGNRAKIKRTKVKIHEAICAFKEYQNYDALAELIRRLPADGDLGTLACDAYNVIKDENPTYFDENAFFPLKELAGIPKKFMLNGYRDDHYKIRTAASMYQTCLKDLNLANYYGDESFAWLTHLVYPPTVVAMITQAENTGDDRVVHMNEFLDCSDMPDKDLINILDNRRESIILNVSGCKKLTDASMTIAAKQCKLLQGLNIDKCEKITGPAIEMITDYLPNLQLVSVEGCVRLTPESLLRVCEKLTKLKVLNMNHCSQITDAHLMAMGTHLRQLEVLHLAYCYALTDYGIYRMCSKLNALNLMSMDLSGCRNLSDEGLKGVATFCLALTYLNISSNTHITDIGMKAITHSLWKLTVLLVEEAFLISDDVWIYDHVGDGRKAAQENMLRSVTELNINDCTRLTNTAMGAMSERMKNLRKLSVGGLSNFTDEALYNMTTEPRFRLPRGENLIELNLSYCIQITDDGLAHIAKGCKKIAKLDISGCIRVSDSGINILSENCTHIQILYISRCKRLTDKALCHLADYLWIEELDISHSNKYTDDGIEVVTMEFTGLIKLNISFCPKITEKSLDSINRNLAQLRELNIIKSGNISEESINNVQETLPDLEIIRKEKEKITYASIKKRLAEEDEEEEDLGALLDQAKEAEERRKEKEAEGSD